MHHYLSIMTHGECEIRSLHIKLSGIQKPNNYNTTLDLLANTKCNLELNPNVGGSSW
jgi:hypothetical protein